MNCFEVRNAFRAAWRHELVPEARRALLDHLRDCATCDRAFRIFALSAPVLHGKDERGERAREPASRSRSTDGAYRASADSRAARTAVAAIVVFAFVAGLAAYLSAVGPRESLDQELAGPEAAVVDVIDTQSLDPLNDLVR